MDVPLRIMYSGDDNDGPWQVTTLALRDDDTLPLYNTIVVWNNPLRIDQQGVWYDYVFRGVDLTPFDDGANGVELYAWAEVDDNDINGFNPDGRSGVCQTAIRPDPYVRRVKGGALNGAPIDGDRYEISVASGARIRGPVAVETYNTMGPGSVAPLGWTADWGLREQQSQLANGWIGTGKQVYTVPIDVNAPETPGDYHIVIAFSGRFTIEQVMSETSQDVPNNPVWYDGNDVGFDWSAEQFAQALGDGIVLTDVLTISGHRPHWLPATAVIVHVLPVENHNGTVFRASGGSINGAPVDGTRFEVTVPPGDFLTGTIVVETANLWGPGAVTPLGGTATWGDRTSQPWLVNGWIPSGTNVFNVTVAKAAPEASGDYAIIMAFGAEFTIQQVMSMTNWAYGPLVWGDGNDVGFDWSPEQLQQALNQGAVLTEILGADGRHPFWLPATAVIVHVRETVADCNANGLPDALDISNGTSLDCNENGVPDECEPSSQDCDGNHVPDSCDIAGDGDLDCNGNGILDRCDIESGQSLDGNQNDIPDDCESWPRQNGGWNSTRSVSIRSSKPTPLASLTERWSADAWSVVTGDVDGDGRLEVGVGFADGVSVYRSDGTLLWARNLVQGAFQVVFDDVDGDGHPDVLVSTRRTRIDGEYHEIYAHRGRDGQQLKIISITANGNEGMGVRGAVDLDRDGDLEVVAIIGSGYGHYRRGLWVFDYASGEERWHYGIGPIPSESVVAANVRGDEKLELLLGGGSVHNGNSENGFPDSGAWLFCLEHDGSLAWASAIGNWQVRGARADIDGDGHVDILAFRGADYYGGNLGVYRLDGADGGIVDAWDGSNGFNFSGFAIGSLVRSADRQVALGIQQFGVNGSFAILASDLTPIVQSPPGPTANTVHLMADVDGDGNKELYVSAGARLNALDAQQNAVGSWFFDADVYETFTSDLDDDGGLDLLVIAGSRLHVLAPLDPCASPPLASAIPSDECSSAQFLGVGVLYSGDTGSATNDGAATCGQSANARDVWFRYIPAKSGAAIISLCGSSYDTVLSVHDGCPEGDSNELACNDDECGVGSRVSLNALAGHTYWLRVAGFGSSAGAFALKLEGPPGAAGGDCNGNGMKDPCEISRCDGSPVCDDCNGNSLPDECDFLAGGDANGDGRLDDCDYSNDCNGNGRPDDEDIRLNPRDDCNDNQLLDECEWRQDPNVDCDLDGQLDACDDVDVSRAWWIGGDGKWNNAGLWCPARVPEQANANDRIGVLVGRTGEGRNGTITLNVSPLLTVLTIEDGFAIEVNTDSGSARTLSVETMIHNRGTLRAAEGRRMLLDAPVMEQGPTGVIEALGLGSKVQINGRRVQGGKVVTDGSGAAIELLGGAVLEDVIVEVTSMASAGATQPTVVVPTGQFARIERTIRNRGTIAVGSPQQPADPARLSPGANETVLFGAGMLRMQSSRSELGGFVGKLVNGEGHTIRGVGVVFGDFENAAGALVQAALDEDADEELRLYPPGEKTNDGTIEVTNAQLVVAADLLNRGVVDLKGRLLVTPEGRITVTPEGSVRVGSEVAPVRCEMGSVLRVEGTLNAEGPVAVAGFGELILASGGTGELHNLRLEGSEDAVCGQRCREEPVATRRGGRTPPKLRIEVGSDLTLRGSVVLNGPVQVAAADAGLTLAGDWQNYSTCVSDFDMATATLRIVGPGVSTVEVAGRDLDPICPARSMQRNFEIETVRVQAGTTARFQDLFENRPSFSKTCGEALFVDTLILEAGSHIEVDNCTVYYQRMEIAPDAEIVRLGCGNCVPLTQGAWSARASCVRGPGLRLDESPCVCWDMDGDQDVDLSDVARYQRLGR